MDATTAFDNASMVMSQPRLSTAQGRDPAKVRETAKQFEAVFATQMLSHMFTAIEAENGLFGGGHAEEMFRPMMLDEYGKMIASHGRGLGVADHVVRELLKAQEAQ